MNTIRHLEDEHDERLIYLDLGPSGTLATFVKYVGIKSRSEVLSTITPFGKEERNIQLYEEAVRTLTMADY